MNLTENILYVQENIKAACERSGRSIDEITLIAVSKTKPLPMLESVYNFGLYDFGENKVQEIMDKYEHMPIDTKWHMIGHLQRNKVKYIIDKVAMIHSVDSIRLAETISKEAAKRNCTVKILLEVNVAKEESKFGFYPDELEDALSQIAKLPHLAVQGLMTIAPFVKNPEENRKHFVQLRKLFVDITMKNIDNINMDVLSMGMSGDYTIAIEEGATMVRIGTGIFGER